MSATIIRLPEGHIKPDMKRLWKILDSCGDDFGRLFAAAELSLQAVHGHQSNAATSAGQQNIVNALALAACALLTILGVPREVLDGGLPSPK